MKNTIVLLALLFIGFSNAQEVKPTPQINVSGEGKVRVVPDQAMITISIDNKGNNAQDVKRLNDATVDKVIKAIRNAKLPKEDVQTSRITLNPIYDYEKKKYSYNATQSISILLKDLSTYDSLMESLIDAGVNGINNVEFKSSKLAQYQSEARKLAIQDAKHRAEDYVSVLGQKVGKAIAISDNTQVYYPQPVYAMRMEKNSDAAATNETLAIGEINVTANVSASFLLE